MTEINENNLPIYLQNYKVTILCYDNYAGKISDNCDFSKFGCCADGITPKKNRNGSNCVPLCGTARYNTVSVNPSNEKRKRVWNFKTSGSLKRHDGDYIIQYNFKDVDYNGQISFENKISGTLNICDRILNMSKISSFIFDNATKRLTITLKLNFRISASTLFSFSTSINSNDKEDSCSIQQLSLETNGFSEINGQTPPGDLATLVDSVKMLSTKNVNGDCVLMVKSIRKAGTRVGIHVHKYGGYTLILKGTMTDFVQGQEIKTYSGSGYYMPPCTPMSAANLGPEDVELIDIFIGPPGEPFIEIMEPNWNFERIERFPE